VTTFTVISGQLEGATLCSSPNFNQRPANTEISLLVIHNISLPPGQFGGGHIEAFFCNRLDVPQDPYFKTISDLTVSAHLLIDRKGDVTQFVGFDARAWHAGKSIFAGQTECNDFSIGIELEGEDDRPYTDKQYQSLALVTQAIMQAYPNITPDRITGHCDIAPGRKTDPGSAFDWHRYKSTL